MPNIYFASKLFVFTILHVGGWGLSLRSVLLPEDETKNRENKSKSVILKFSHS